MSRLFLGLLLVSSCAVTSEEPHEESTQSSALIESCYDWSGTCTGLPEGSACGNSGTCTADTYGVAGWCTCYEPPPTAGFTCPNGNSCSGLADGSACQRRGGTSGTCVAYSGGLSNVPTNCMCF
jgi:hypothetical protein